MEQRSEYKSEMDFGDVLRKPHKLFGATYLYFLALLAVIGILYVNRLTAVGKNDVMPAALKDSSAFVRDLPMQSPMVLPPVDVRVAAIPTDSILARGREVYRANCVSCHGEGGQGDGPAGMALNPKPRNFHDPSGWTNGAGIAQIYKTLQEGIVRNGMASYAYLPPGDRFALIHVVRKFQPAPPADTEEEILGLDAAYQLSKGTVIAAQIPLGDASRRLIEEHASAVARIKEQSQSVETGKDPGEALFAQVAADHVRALTAMQSVRSRVTTLDDFIRLVSADPVQLGFRTTVNQLSRADWEMLHQFVMR